MAIKAAGGVGAKVDHEGALEKFGSVLGNITTIRDADAVSRARAAVLACVGEEGLADAVGVVSTFAFVTRAVDGSGHTSVAEVADANRAIRIDRAVRAVGGRDSAAMLLIGAASVVVALVAMRVYKR